jgi:acetolactate synthase-1/2/3 large subunit
MKLSDYLMQFVAARGVRHVFVLTGGAAMHLNDSLGKESRLAYVCCLHEQACAIAAEAYGKLTQGLGVAMVTAGPGSTNAVTGVAGAWFDSTPCMFISGQVKRADLKGRSGVRQMGVQEIDIVSVVQSITKYAVTLTDPNTARYHVEKAAYLATHGRPGPVWIDVPLDVQAAEIDPAAQEGFLPPVEEGAGRDVSQRVREALALFAAAKRPFLLFGNGIRLAGAQEEMRQVIERLQAPFGLTWPALDLAPSDDPLLVGRPGPMAPRGANFALQNSDFLLSVGARLDLATTAFAPQRFARAAKRVIVDVDPAEIERLRPHAAVAACADAKAFLQELLAQARDVQPARADWNGRCATWKNRYPVVLPEHRRPEDRVSTYHFTEVLCDLLEEGEIVVPCSSGTALEIFLLAFAAKRGQRVFNTTGLGAMGFGIPAALGACVAANRKRTVCVDGDGGFLMNIQELETVSRLALPIKFFVINNGGYRSIVASQQTYFGRLVGAEPSSGVTLPDLLPVARSFGIPGERIVDQRDLRAGLRRALEHEGPFVCELLAVEDEVRAPRVTSVQGKNGAMVSKPLEDLWPFLDRAELQENMIVPLED